MIGMRDRRNIMHKLFAMVLVLFSASALAADRPADTQVYVDEDGDLVTLHSAVCANAQGAAQGWLEVIVTFKSGSAPLLGCWKLSPDNERVFFVWTTGRRGYLPSSVFVKGG
jgi:hypothetical protein